MALQDLAWFAGDLLRSILDVIFTTDLTIILKVLGVFVLAIIAFYAIIGMIESYRDKCRVHSRKWFN